MNKPSAVGAILQAKCPRCRRGDMFQYSLFNPVRFATMHDTCPHCGFRFEVEPGFFYGAMFVGYAISVAQVVFSCMLTYVLFNDPDTMVYLAVAFAVVILTMSINFRYSRVLMLYWFGGVKYNEKYA